MAILSLIQLIGLKRPGGVKSIRTLMEEGDTNLLRGDFVD